MNFNFTSAASEGRKLMEQEIDTELKAKLHSETAKIAWSELQRFFAQGSVLQIDEDLDLVQVAVWFAEDDSNKLEPYITSGSIAPPSNDKARAWFATSAELWSVVVAPFVLVQESKVDEEKSS